MDSHQPPDRCVAHIVDTYLGLTNSWIYNQIATLRQWRPIVLARLKANLDLFPLKPGQLYVIQDSTLPFRVYHRAVSRLFGFYPRYKQVATQENVRLFHAHFGRIGYQVLRLARSLEVPLITTFYGWDLSRLPQEQPRWRARYRRLFAEGALFLVEGSHMREQLISLGCPPAKVLVQHLGVDLEKLHFEPRRPDDDGSVRVLVAGTFTEKKGIPYALEAFARVCERYKRLHLTVIGDARRYANEQRIKAQLPDIIRRYGIQDRVTFMGYQPHHVLIETFYNHHIFMSPSVQAQDGDNEGGAPVTITEALATGMPVLSTFHCDIPEVVVNEKGGFLVPERDIDALAAKLTFLLENPEIWEQIGRYGHEHVMENYDVVKQSQRLEAIYDSVLNPGYHE